MIRFPEEKCDALMRGHLDATEVEGLGLDNVRAIMREEGRTHYANVASSMLAADPSTDRKVARYTMITESALPPFDRVVLVDGIDLREFKRRGSPLLFAHGRGKGEDFPLGMVENVDKGAKMRGRRAMSGDANFKAADVWPFAGLVWEMVQAGVIRGGSIGFDIMGEREPTKDEARFYGIKSALSQITTKAKLVEFSVVSLGRDPSAQVQRIQNSYSRRLENLCREGAFSRDDADDFLGMVSGAAVSSRSYFDMTNLPEGWAAGLDLSASSTSNEEPSTMFGALPEELPSEARLASLEDRVSRIESINDNVETTAALAGTVQALRQEMRSMRARQASAEAEAREAYSLIRRELSRSIDLSAPEPRQEEPVSNPEEDFLGSLSSLLDDSNPQD
jgi:hypothetical protein